MNYYGSIWEQKNYEDLKRDNLELRVGIETACKIKRLAYECEMGATFDEQKWADGLAELLGYRLPRLHYGESYKLVIMPRPRAAASLKE